MPSNLLLVNTSYLHPLVEGGGDFFEILGLRGGNKIFGINGAGRERNVRTPKILRGVSNLGDVF